MVCLVEALIQSEGSVAQVAKLRRENHKLRETNELRNVSSPFCIGARTKAPEGIQFIDELRDRFSIEFMCKALRKHRAHGFITSCSYR